jgi:hypothetical protein
MRRRATNGPNSIITKIIITPQRPAALTPVNDRSLESTRGMPCVNFRVIPYQLLTPLAVARPGIEIAAPEDTENFLEQTGDP